jgi:hypothetical protein
MKSILLRHRTIVEPKQNRENNLENGNDAEVLSASMLLKAMGAEVSWGSRNEDGRKIDLICSYDHPWISKERLIFFVQVKSGSTYGRKLPIGFTLLGVAKKSAQRTSHPICLIWVERQTNSTYWAYIHPFSTNESQHYGDNHLVNPATRFDIARCQAKVIPGKSEGSGIIIKELTGTLKIKRAYALKKYKSLKNKTIINPNLGIVEFTRVGWRHMFRKQRSSMNKEKSMNLIPYLANLLEHKPSKIYITKNELESERGYEFRTSEYVLTYDKVEFNNAGKLESTSVIIRLLEEIMWPEDWKENSMLSQLIKRRLVLLSAYYK